MQEQDLKLELNKILIQQQWHDAFIQRENHWFWPKGFWLFMGDAALASVLATIVSVVIR